MWPFKKKKLQQEPEENRAGETAETESMSGDFLAQLLGARGGSVTRETTLQVPTLNGGIDLIASLIAGTPIKLYHDNNGKAVDVKDDPRIRLLNDDTGDTLDANQFWHAVVRDYYLGGGAYAYINRHGNTVTSLHYVRHSEVYIAKNDDPIFKDYDILVRDNRYKPYEFLKVLRNSIDGATGSSITGEISKLIEAAYESLVLEGYLAQNGGHKRGFLKSEKKLSKDSLDELRTEFNRRYSTRQEKFVVLNDGIDFKETSSTSAELQLNENKTANADEFAKILHVSAAIMSGKADENDIASLARLAAIPLMKAIECALNRDLLLESEKDAYYWAFDTKELLKGDTKTRFDAYKTALDANFMQIDEVRYAEDMEPLGLTWIKLGLNDVLYDPQSKTVYTPNTDRTAALGKGQIRLPSGDEDGNIEPRGHNPYRSADGKFAPGPAKTKYAPSPRRSNKGITVSEKKYAKLTGTLNTRYPGLEKGEKRRINDAKYRYTVEADGFGGMSIIDKQKI